MTTLPKPDVRFLLRHPAHFLALGFGSGLITPAPGTWGSIAALPLAAGLHLAGAQGVMLAWLALPLFVLGVWVCGVTGRALGVADSGHIVWDEIVAMLLVLAAVPATPVAWLAALLVFRVFDIVKPWPIRWLDARVHGGFGVMLDDVVAALFAVLVLWSVLPYLPA
ncbi:phosphatidylglycerophosphatase A [Vogesella sp. XCS3]|uniref:phosphatidylglycerophosphatase A family protein n=1 Tax=Vogesella sp. XCS3 TaxID=2877939 RepID=UPI001D0AB3DB|nr:phosphatidylglycerophosphatase A [Vogesella sp. XCS3]UDM18120.1 phosphatidylglycerophosphatase A [Vogesella sp. XCS3]